MAYTFDVSDKAYAKIVEKLADIGGREATVSFGKFSKPRLLSDSEIKKLKAGSYLSDVERTIALNPPVKEDFQLEVVVVPKLAVDIPDSEIISLKGIEFTLPRFFARQVDGMTLDVSRAGQFEFLDSAGGVVDVWFGV